MRSVEKIKADIATCKPCDRVRKNHICTEKECRDNWEDCYQSYLNGMSKLRVELFEAITCNITIERLQEICSAEKDGRCYVAPCKVGQTVYVIAKCKSVHVLRDDDYFTGTGAMECPFENQCSCEDCNDENEQVFETTVTDFWHGEQNGKNVEMFLEHMEMSITENDIGKTIFLTPESAEAALKERESNG